MYKECYILTCAFDAEGKQEEFLCAFDKAETAKKATNLRPNWKGARISKAYYIGVYLLGNFGLLKNGVPRKINIISAEDRDKLELYLNLHDKRRELDKIVSKMSETELKLLREFKEDF